MLGFGCGTVRLNQYGDIDGTPPVMKLVGDQLTKRDTKYWKIEDTVTNLEIGLKLGTSSTCLLGTPKMVNLGFHSEHTIGKIPFSEIYRESSILGEEKPFIFGQREFEQIGIVNINSHPPSAIILPYSKLKVKLPENYWTVATENIKKISNAIKKYFKDITE